MNDRVLRLGRSQRRGHFAVAEKLKHRHSGGGCAVRNLSFPWPIGEERRAAQVFTVETQEKRYEETSSADR